MRLLNVRTLEFKEFYAKDVLPYTITSHRWTDDEVSFKDFSTKRKPESKGHKKVEGFCTYVRKDNKSLLSRNPSLPVDEWIWIDTCCIDKKSTAEVSESINSMFQWYSQARECVAFLADVRPLSHGWNAIMNDFNCSEWFARGWTLQELLVPRSVIFLTRNWEVIGHKRYFCLNTVDTSAGAGPLLNKQIAMITGIDESILSDYSKGRNMGVKEQLKWMDRRETTKTEDTAYCLLGLFDVSMPLLYGAGHKALLRLGEQLDEAMRKSQDSKSNLGPECEDIHTRLAPMDHEIMLPEHSLHHRSKIPQSQDSKSNLSSEGEDVHTRLVPMDHEIMPTKRSVRRRKKRPQTLLESTESHQGVNLDSQDSIEQPELGSYDLTPPSHYMKSSNLLMRMMEQTRSNTGETSVRQFATSPSRYYCWWEPCNSNKYLMRKADLDRHIRALHTRDQRLWINCEHLGCDRRGQYGFIRRAKMIERMRMTHNMEIPKRKVSEDSEVGVA